MRKSLKMGLIKGTGVGVWTLSRNRKREGQTEKRRLTVQMKFYRELLQRNRGKETELNQSETERTGLDP